MPKSAEGLASHVDSDDEDSPSNPAQYGEKNLLKVTIIDLPYNVVQILDTDVKLPGWFKKVLLRLTVIKVIITSSLSTTLAHK